MDKKSLLSASELRHSKTTRRKRIACCAIFTVMSGLICGVGFFTLSQLVSVPDDTSAITVNEIQVGSRKGTANYRDLCSYDLPIEFDGELPGSMKVPSFVSVTPIDPKVTLTDLSTEPPTLIAVSTDLDIDFTSSTTYAITTAFDFSDTASTDALAAFLSRTM